ncbi:MAG: ester cyclase [Actinomycetota bacterium]
MTAEQHRALLSPLRAALYTATPDVARSALRATLARDAVVQLAFPFETMAGPDGWFDAAFAPLLDAFPDLERRDWIVMAGPDANGERWVGCGGHYTGTFLAPFLDIPPTGHQASMRYHEFFRIDGGRVVEVQALWDIPELMMQAGVWPMGPSLGREWQIPGPATQDGIITGPRDDAHSKRAYRHVVDMLTDMGKHPTEPVEIMRLEHWWHPRFSWYGPAGIGTARGVPGFRHHHQIPFLEAMPDRRGGGEAASHFFADGDYVAVTAWPGMSVTMTGDGWLGIAPTGKALTMRSLDFWRVETVPDGSLKIRENWVLVDLLSVWDQLGVDVFGRMRELTTPARRASGHALDP